MTSQAGILMTNVFSSERFTVLLKMTFAVSSGAGPSHQVLPFATNKWG